MNLKLSFTVTLLFLSEYVCEGEQGNRHEFLLRGPWVGLPSPVTQELCRSAPVQAPGHPSSLRVLFTLSCVMPAWLNAWRVAAVAGLAGSPADSMGGNDKREFYAWLKALFIFLN